MGLIDDSSCSIDDKFLNVGQMVTTNKNDKTSQPEGANVSSEKIPIDNKPNAKSVDAIVFTPSEK